jgi:acyl-CoA synthetase (AMP-forming)/AMP-acid ligase II
VTSETIPALLADRGRDSGQREAIVDHGHRIDYATLDRRSAGRAAYLVSKGVNKGHRVALLMPNGAEWAVNAYAIMRIGAVLTPLSTLLRPPELAAQLSLSGVRHMISISSYRGRDYRAEVATLDRAQLPSLRDIWWADELEEAADQTHSALATALSARVNPADDMAIIFTSGSRGLPKGVIHTHGAAIRAVAAGLHDRCVRRETRLYLPMPLFWVGGLGGGLLSALIAGATLLTEPVFEPAETLRFLARERATLFRGWPDQAVSLATHPEFKSTDLSSLQPGSLEAMLPSALRGTPGSRAILFGMTETFGTYCGYPLDRDLPAGKFGSCGRPFAGMALRIVAAESGTPLPKGEIGSIQIGGRNLLRGICGREREEVFTRDGWYDTGDLGRLDDDGFLFFVSRRDDMVKIKGASVYPSEVEVALQTMTHVQRAFVTDLSIDGATTLGAAVIPSLPGVLRVARLAKEAKERLSAFKIPSRWAVLDSIDQVPRLPTGKIDTPALRALLLASEPSE